jgi:hypothetical protein
MGVFPKWAKSTKEFERTMRRPLAAPRKIISSGAKAHSIQALYAGAEAPASNDKKGAAVGRSAFAKPNLDRARVTWPSW